MSIAKKPCVYCDALFTPDARVGDRQKSCRKQTCRKKRHSEAHAAWLKKNPEAYQGRYSNTKTWLSGHPNFLRGYRAENPGYVKADNQRHRERRRAEKERNADIQDARLRRRIREVKLLRGADIQDEMRLKITGILELFEVWPTQYRADIQDSMEQGRDSLSHSRL